MKHLPLAILMCTTTFACDEGAPAEEPTGSIVEAGKADDFLSLSAREYWVEGTTRIVLDASWAAKPEAERLKEIKRLIPARQIVIGWFLNQYLVDKEEEGYGGFKSLTKNGAYEDLNLKKVDERTWSFDFRQQVGGQEDLITALPDAKALGNGVWTFDLVIGKISTADMQRLDTDREWYRDAPWGSFNPANVAEDKKEIQALKISLQPAEDDAWVDLDRLMEDGKLSIGIHFGWDYHSAYHEKHSKDVYTWLVSRKGFKSPVAKWEDLRHDAGPLKGSVTWRGKKVAAEVSLFWGRKGDAGSDPDTAAGGKQLEADMFTSLKSREVVIFSGHSGPFYGFALANWKVTSEGDVDDSELAVAELWKDHYQLVVAEGCDTYGIGQSFALNPSKPGLKDLDVITTTSFSNAASAGTITDTLSVLLGAPGSATATATKYSQLLADLDANSSWFDSMYGVHGLDDNPHVHPWADLSKACKTCSTNGACGDGMRCVKMKDGKKACAAECTSSLGCGTGYECRNVSVDSYLATKVCAPISLQCGVAAPAAGKLIINEVMPNPSADSNGDGTKDTTADEYVEIVNGGAQSLDVSGWSLSDGTSVRHRFPSGSIIAPGGALVVFGGGTAKLSAGTTVLQVASGKSLGLNNTGDTVNIADKDGITVAQVAWASGLAAGKSWARQTDLDSTASFAAIAPSPGTKSDGSQC